MKYIFLYHSHQQTRMTGSEQFRLTSTDALLLLCSLNLYIVVGVPIMQTSIPFSNLAALFSLSSLPTIIAEGLQHSYQ